MQADLRFSDMKACKIPRMLLSYLSGAIRHTAIIITRTVRIGIAGDCWHKLLLDTHLHCSWYNWR